MYMPAYTLAITQICLYEHTHHTHAMALSPICLCKCEYTYTYIYQPDMPIYIHTYIYIRPSRYIHTYTYSQRDLHTCIHAYKHTCIHTYIHTNTHIHIQYGFDIEFKTYHIGTGVGGRLYGTSWENFMSFMKYCLPPGTAEKLNQ